MSIVYPLWWSTRTEDRADSVAKTMLSVAELFFFSCVCVSEAQRDLRSTHKCFYECESVCLCRYCAYMCLCGFYRWLWCHPFFWFWSSVPVWFNLSSFTFSSTQTHHTPTDAAICINTRAQRRCVYLWMYVQYLSVARYWSLFTLALFY